LRNFYIYGNPTLDYIEEADGTVYVAYGGGSYYSALPLLEKGLDVEVYAVYSPGLSAHPVSKYVNKMQYSTRMNIFKLEYTGTGRRIRVLDKAPPICSWNSQGSLGYSIVNPVLGEVDASLLKTVRQKSPLLAVDLQGFLRKLAGGSVVLEYTDNAMLAIQLADIVHADLEEFTALAGGLSIPDAVHKISKKLRGVLLVTIRPKKVMVVTKHGSKVYELEDYYAASDKTGAGDYFLSVYTYTYVEKHDEEGSVFKAHEYTTAWLKTRRASLHHHRSAFHTAIPFHSSA